MLQAAGLKDLLAQDLSDREKVLLCLAADPVAPRAVKAIRLVATDAGWRQAKKKDLPNLLRRAKGLAVRTPDGWELTSDGFRLVAQLAGPLLSSPIPKVASSLRTHLTTLTDQQTQSFVEEAIACFETRQFRAAVVLSWVGAVSVLQKHVVEHKLTDFNVEAQRRDPKWKNAQTTDDLGLMKEDTMLDVLQAISVLGKNVKQELKKALVLRNGCGHPNSLQVAEHKVSAHIEDLILNVFSSY